MNRGPGPAFSERSLDFVRMFDNIGSDRSIQGYLIRENEQAEREPLVVSSRHRGCGKGGLSEMGRE